LDRLGDKMHEVTSLVGNVIETLPENATL